MKNKKKSIRVPDMKWMTNIQSKGIKLSAEEIRSATVSGGESSFCQIEAIKKNIRSKENQSFKVVSDKKLLKKLKSAKIELAPTNEIDKYQREIKIILNILGHKEALVTDESSVWDFLAHFGSEKENKKYNKDILEKTSCRLLLDIKASDLLIDIAKRIRNK